MPERREEVLLLLKDVQVWSGRGGMNAGRGRLKVTIPQLVKGIN